MKPNWFVALPVPAHSWLPSVMADLPNTCRPFRPEDVHMTVAFFGAMDPTLQDEVVRVMASIREKPLVIRLGPLLTLPSEKRLSALSFSVTRGQEEAKSLIARWRDSLIRAARGRRETRPPLAHITVARPLRKAREQGKREGKAWARRVVPPTEPLALDRIALYTWAEDRRAQQFQIKHEQLFS